MSVFKSEKFIPVRLADYSSAAQALMSHFRHQDFEVAGDETLTGGWEVSIHKGGLFKAVLGMKTALKVSIEPQENGTVLKAGIGIFGQQFIPTLIMLGLFWPVILTQLWGMVKQSNLDDEALGVIEKSLSSPQSSTPTAMPTTPVTGADRKRFCTQCGAQQPMPGKFCSECGQPLPN